MANEIGSFVVSIQAKVEGYQAEIDKIKKALSEVGANTQIGKDLGKQLAAVEKQVDSLARKMTQRISSESQITRLKDNLDGIDLAFQKIGNTMQKVNFSDLDMSKLSDGFKTVLKEYQELESKLSSNMGEGFSAALEKRLGSGRLKEILEGLKIDPKQLNYENFAQVFAAAIESNKAKVQELKAEIEDLKNIQKQANAAAAEYGKAGNIDQSALIDNLKNALPTGDIRTISSSALGDLQENINKYLRDLQIDDKIIQEKIKPIFDNINSSQTMGQLQTNLNKLAGEIATGLKGVLNLTASDVKSGFEASTQIPWKQLINLDSFKEFDVSKLETIKTALQQFFTDANNLGQGADEAAKSIEHYLNAFKTTNSVEVIKELTAALKEYVEAMAAAKAAEEGRSAAAAARTGEAKSKINQLNNDSSSVRANATILEKQVEKLREENGQSRSALDEKEKELNQLRNQGTENVRKTGGGVSNDAAKGLEDNARAAQQYAEQLAHVKDAEKLVGKIEGIAQRWFSIYAAVRMVTNAIRSMKATIEDLDKTITEIAIVTNMSQSDLWGQMGKYTQLAREYAASIKGVYEVSQLYYQQGLQTADVMALTEQTLKMARISGLSYKDATDYMTNAVRSFKMEMTDAQRVVDVYSAIAASSATNVTELAEAMSKTASSAEAVGSSFENTTAMMAVMIEATREAPQNIGSALKSIISRYGEMKADPAKLVDSEGEELSFNKVDTALQSVGISIKNAEGQFRNFDDVIKELAASWDTIDVNTQRYIATIMAGNRQQSRFLALVSNYDRYEELSAKAADAENASQLQFLKTLDSVQAKTQQLQTSLQSLYTGSGIQDLYKGILDVSNAIIQSFTSMPTLFNLPIAAVLKFGATFWSLASVVKSVFGLIINQLAIEKTKANMLINGEIAVVQNAENQKVQATAESYNEMNAIIAQKLKEREQLTQEEADFYAKQQLAKANSLRSTGTGQLGSFSLPGGKTIGVTTLGLNTGALLANLAGTALKSQTNGIAQGAGGILSIAGSAMSGAAMGSFIPGGAAVGAVLGTLVGAFSNLNNILPNTARELENLTKIAEERKNKALQEQAEAKSLQSSIDKLKELEKTRYSSIEAEQAYLEASDTLAQQYPELIQKYDETGKAIIDLAAANDLLQVSLQKSADAVRDAAIANYNRVKAEKESNPFFTSTAGKTSTLLQNLQQSDNQNVRTKVATADLTGIHGSSDIIKNINNEFLKTIANSFLTENISTKEVYEGLTTSIDAAKKLESLNEFDQAVLDAIDQNLSSYTKEITRAISNDNKLSAAGESGARTYINSLLQMTAYQDKFFNDISDSNNILATILINQFKDYNGDYEKYMQDIPNNLEKAQEKLKEAIETISPKEFNKLIDLRKTTSAQGIATYINNNFKDLDAEITQALLDYFNNIYNIEDFKANISNFDNSGVRQLLINFSDYFNNLTDTELQAINNYAEQIQKELSSGALTNVQAGKKLTAYLSIWKQLESSSSELSEEQINTAESLLQSWDGTKEGLEAIQASIPSTNATKPLLTFIDELLKRIPENLNTSLQTLTSSITSKTKDFKDISQLSKGVELDKAIKYAEELDLSFNDLELDYSTGLFKLKDLNKGYGHFFDKIDKQINDLIGQTQKFTNTDVLSNLQTLANMTATQRNENDNSQYYDKISAIYNDLDKNAVDEILTAYDAAKEAARAAGDAAPQLSDFIAQHYTEEATFLQAVIKDVKIRAELNVGRISEAIKLITGLTDENSINNIISSLTKNNGKINEQDLIEAGQSQETINALKNYGLILNETFESATKKVYDKAIESITKGKQDIDVNEFNEDLLKSLGAEIDEKTKKATINWQGLTVGTEEYNKKIAIILEGGITKEEEEILKSLEEAINGRSAVEVADSVINSWDKVSSTAALLFKSTFNLKDDDFAKAFTWDPIAKVYRSNLDKVREIIRDGSQLSEKDQNKALADIDKAIRESSGINIFNDIAKNYNQLTEESIQKLADKLNLSYDLVKAQLESNGDGTYKIDFQQLQNLQAGLGAAADKSAKEIIASIIDGYISQLSGISQIQGQGYTNLADMQKLANEVGESTSSLFTWDSNLRAYILSVSGIGAIADHAKEELARIQDPQEKQQAIKLITANAQTLADSINFNDLIDSIGTSEFEKQAETFRKAVVDYNYFILQFSKKGLLTPSILLEQLQKGGMEALRAANIIANAQGKQLSGADIEKVYRSGMTRINTALDQVQLSIGSIIDQSTVELLNIGDKVSKLANGKYVITGAINLVDAYEQLLQKMANDEAVTLSELNALEVRILSQGQNKSLNAAQSLKDIANISYETLAKIAEDLGTDVYGLIEKLGSSIEDLGNGQARITNFEKFVDITGIEKGTEAYTEAYIAYNDAIISSQNKNKENLLNAVKNISNAKGGDKVNITALVSNFDDNLIASINMELMRYGGYISQGILRLEDNANISAITQLIAQVTEATGEIAERDMAEIQDAIEQLLNNITEAIKKGLNGNLSNVEKYNLTRDLNANYGVQLDDNSWIKTAEGWQLAADAAFEVVDAMQQIDALQGNLVLQEFRSSLKEAQFDVRDLYGYASSLGYKVNEGNYNVVSHVKNSVSGKELYNAGWTGYEGSDENVSFKAETRTSDAYRPNVKIGPDRDHLEAAPITELPIIVNISPVTNDGKTIKSPEDVDEYLKGLFSKGKTAAEIMELDRQQEGLLISARDVESWDDVDKAIAEAEHELEILESQSETLSSRWKEISEINLMEATSKNDAMDFMNNKLPDAMENPLKYYESWGKAIDILQNGSGKGKKKKSGFVDARDWYNIVNEMNHIAGLSGKIKMYGVTLDGDLESASQLIQKGFSNLESVDGGQLKVNLSKLGVAFEDGALDLKGDVSNGIEAMAQSQIDMLDGLIQVLETIVAMQEAFEGMEGTEDGEINLKDIFPNINTEGFDGEVSEGFQDAAISLLEASKKNKDLQDALEQIKIEDQTLSSLLKQAATEGKIVGVDYQAFTNVMNGLYKAGKSGNYDTNNIYESVKSILASNGATKDGKLSVDIGRTTIYLTGSVTTQINWDDKKVKEAIAKRFTTPGPNGETPEQQARSLLKQFHSEPLTVTDEQDLKLIEELTPELNHHAKKGKKGKEYWTVGDGKQKFYSRQAAAQAYALMQEGVKDGDVVVDSNNAVTGGKIILNDGMELIINLTPDGKKTYKLGDYTGDSIDSVVDQYLQNNDSEYAKLDSEDAKTNYKNKWMIDAGIIQPELEVQPKFTFSEGSPGATQENTKAFQELLAEGKEINGKDLSAKFGINTTIQGALTTQEIQEVAALFGVEYKPTVLQLSVNSTGITEHPLAELITTGTGNAELSLTLKPGETSPLVGDGTDTENGAGFDLGEIPVTGKLIVTPNGFGLAPEEQGKEGQKYNIDGLPSTINTDNTVTFGVNNGGYTLNQGEGGQTEGEGAAATLVGNVLLPDVIPTGGSVKLGVSSSGFTLSSGENGEQTGEAGFLNQQLGTWAASLVAGVNSVDTQKGIDLLVSVSQFLTKPAEGEIPLTLSPEIQAAIKAKGETSEQQMTLGVVVSKILAGTSSTGTGTGTGTQGEGGAGGPEITLADTVLAILNKPYSPEETLELLLTIGAIKTQIDAKNPAKPDYSSITGLKAGLDGNLSFEEIVSLLLNITSITSQNNTGSAPTGDSIGEEIGIESEYTTSEKKLVIPVKVFMQSVGEFEWENENPLSPNGTYDDLVPKVRANGIEGTGLKQYAQDVESFQKAGGKLSSDTINKITSLKDLFETSLSDEEGAGGLTEQFDRILQASQGLKEGNATGQITELNEGITALADIDTSAIDACVTAMQQLWEKASALRIFDWADLRTKLNEFFSGKNTQNGEENLNTDLTDITLNIHADYGGDEAIKQIIQATGPIERTIKLKVEKTGDDTGDTSDTDNNNDNNNTGNTGNTGNNTNTDTTNTTNLELDTSSVTQALETLQSTLSNTVEPLSQLAGAMSSIPTNKASEVVTLASGMKEIPTDKDQAINNLVDAIKKIPNQTNIKITANLTAYFRGQMSSPVKVEAMVVSKARGDVSQKAFNSFLNNNSNSNLAQAKGATRKTLMGELGPELYVTNGHYYMAGAHGAEFVSLPGDAIVFNHLQTQQLMNRGFIYGHGKPVTNELKAISYAKGSPMGPAMSTTTVNINPADYVQIANKNTTQEIGQITFNGMVPPVGLSGPIAIAPNDADPATHHINIGKSQIFTGLGGFGFAKGNVNGDFSAPLGPAQASASAALAALKQLRAMWASMLNTSAKDLGSQAGRNGGGGKGGKNGAEKDKNGKPLTSVIAEINRWYNLVRRIEKCEEQITLYEKQQATYESDRIANGDKIYQRQKQQLDVLKEQIKYEQDLSKLQKSWYEKKAQEFADSAYSKIYTFNKDTGLLQYRTDKAGKNWDAEPGTGYGLDILENLSRRDTNNVPTGNAANAKKQLQYLQSVGFSLSALLVNDDGSKIADKISSSLKFTGKQDDEAKDEELYVQMMENFWDGVDSWREELDSVWKSYQDQLQAIEENQQKQNKILQEWVDNELEVENKLLEAIEAREQAVIDKLNEQKTVLEKSTQSFVNGLKEQLDREKDIQSKNDEQEALTKLQRQLAILQRSGGSASQIKSLQDQIASKQQDMYYNGRQDEIDTIQKAADKQLERLDKQIEILTETLEYQKKNGLFWDEIREIMNKSEEYATSFYNEWVVGKSGNSILQQGEDLRAFRQDFQEWIGYREHKEKEAAEQAEKEAREAAISEFQNNSQTAGAALDSMRNPEDRDTAIQKAEEAGYNAYQQHLKDNPGDLAGAQAAGQAAYDASMQKSQQEMHDKYKNEDFESHYEQWMKNRKVANPNDITTKKAFTAKEGTFKSAMKSYYLNNYDAQGDTAALWENAINVGESKISIGKNGTLNKKATIYTNKGKNTKKTRKKGSKLTFDQAKKIGKVKYLHIKGYDQNNGWIKVDDVKSGSTIYNYLPSTQLSALSNKVNYVSNTGSANGYYNPKLQTSLILDKKLRRSDLKFPSNKVTISSTGKQVATSKDAVNYIRISDIKNLKWDGKNVKSYDKVKVNGFSKNGKDKIETIKAVWIKPTKNLTAALTNMAKKNTQWKNLFNYLNKYEAGGMADFTGPAWLDGTKNRPEAVLNAAQTNFLRNDLLGHQDTSLMSIVQKLQENYKGTLDNTSNGENIIFENIDVTFEAGTISNDYDMRRASEMFKDELVKMARKSGSRSVARR